MKILMIAPQPFFSPRGTPFSVYYRIKTLCEMGHQVDLITYHIGDDVAIEGLAIFRTMKIPFVHKVKIGPSGKKLYLDILIFIKTISRILHKQYDLIHAHEEAVFFCPILKKLFHIPYIYDMHSCLSQQLRNFKFSKNKYLIHIFEILESWSINNSKLIITICHDLQKLIKEKYSNKYSILIENALFDLIEFPHNGHLGENHGLNLTDIFNLKNKRLILYTGTFEAYQGIPLILESIPLVIKKNQDVIFIFIGGTNLQIAKFRSHVREKGFHKWTIFAGSLSPNEVKRFMKNADLLVSSRITGTNTPLKIYEYMASRVPIVATDIYSHRQILNKRNAILCKPDGLSLANAILLALNDPILCKEIKQGAYRTYSNRFGNNVYRKKLQKAFTNCMF